MSRTRARRAPFVVTLALLSTAGCGGKSDADGTGGAGGLGGAGGNPPIPMCPAALPDAGTSCAMFGAKPCTYGDSCTSLTATCVGGSWEIASASPPCNPPVPICPAAPPSDGTSCNSAGMQCDYPGTAPCNGTTHASCGTDQTWTVWMDVGPCNPPPPEELCPSAQPVEGAPCAVAPSEICTFSDQCCSVEYQCVNGAWQDVTGFECNPPAPICPTTPPANGDACSSDPCAVSACAWDLCAEGKGKLSAICASNQWLVHDEPCN